MINTTELLRERIMALSDQQVVDLMRALPGKDIGTMRLTLVAALVKSGSLSRGAPEPELLVQAEDIAAVREFIRRSGGLPDEDTHEAAAIFLTRRLRGRVPAVSRGPGPE